MWNTHDTQDKHYISTLHTWGIQLDSAETYCRWQEDTLALENKFVDFQTQIMKIKEWLGRAEMIVGAHSRLSEVQQRATPHRETIKVIHVYPSWLYWWIMQSSSLKVY